MNADERRRFLEVKGFSVAPRSFPDSDGSPLHYVLELLLDGTRGAQTQNSNVENNLLGRQYSVNLESGVWNKWGTVERYAFDAGPWNELASDCDHEPIRPETKPAPAAAHSEPTGFIAECASAGFVLDEEGPNRIADGILNWMATFDGQLYVLLDQGKVRSIVGPKYNFQSRSLEQFLRDQEQNQEPTPPPKAAARPFVSMREKPLTFSGNSKQESLF